MAPLQPKPQKQQQQQQRNHQSTDSAAASLQEPLLSNCSNGGDIANDAEEPVDENSTADYSKDIVIPQCCRGADRSPIRVNHNVLLNLVLAVLYGISGSLWNGTAYAAYLKKLGRDKNGPFGDIEAVYGLATLVTALPVGYLADRWGRSKVITAGGILLLVSTVFQTWIMEWVGVNPDVRKTDAALWLLAVVNMAWGIGDGVVQGPCSALFADSTPKGKRSAYYNYLFACYTGASAVGPLVSIVLFQKLGNDWSMQTLRTVIYVGLSLELFNACLMMLFDDKKALDDVDDDDDEEEEEGAEEHQQQQQQPMNGEAAENGEGVSTDVVPEDETDEVEEELTPLQKRQQWIPYIIFAQDLVTSLGSGMTIKFFPLFFKDEIGMTPSQVQIIFCVAPLAMVGFSTLGSKIAGSGFGRVQTQLLFSSLGVSCLYTMVFFKNSLDKHPIWLVPIYVFRTSFMNASYPLQESILMDFVPKDVRARWKSLDSVAAFGWCGSAALGGWLADRFDYTYSFLITAVLQSTAIGIWALLLPLVPRKEGDDVGATEELANEEDAEQQQQQQPSSEEQVEEGLVESSAEISGVDSSSDSLHQPLLPKAE